jgi:hypothetical protein
MPSEPAVQMQLFHDISPQPLDHKRWYYANRPSPAVPDGFGDEPAIRAVWAGDRERRDQLKSVPGSPL